MLQEQVPAVRDDPASGAFQAGHGDVWPVSRRRRPNTSLRFVCSPNLVSAAAQIGDIKNPMGWVCVFHVQNFFLAKTFKNILIAK